MSPATSVIICTHNPRADYLARVLAALRAQTLPADRWELVVVDNGSKEPLSGRVDVSWHPNARVVREDELGLTPARLRGIAEARADLLVFVDDDNVLDPGYLAEADRIGRECPFLGAWSGELVGRFDEPPPAWTAPYHKYLGIRAVPAVAWALAPLTTNPALPFGAGLCVRTPVARAWAEVCRADPVRRGFGRTGQGLGSCEDLDLALTACDLGLGTGLFPTLRLDHLMPPGRLTLDYLCRIAEGTAYSHVVLRFVRGRQVPPPPPPPAPPRPPWRRAAGRVRRGLLGVRERPPSGRPDGPDPAAAVLAAIESGKARGGAAARALAGEGVGP